jgi:Gdp/GTP exchange factor required for growth at low temperatures
VRRRQVGGCLSFLPDADVTPDFDHSDSASLSPCLVVSPFADNSDIPLPDPALVPLPETSMHSRYSPKVFDVLQTYCGLPLLDCLLPSSVGKMTIKMSLRANDSAAPRDDPRFVLWRETHLTSDADTDELSLSQGSHPGISPTSSRRGNPSVNIPSLRVSTHDPNADTNNCRVLLAATIERWIAQLTLDFNYEELLNFFLAWVSIQEELDVHATRTDIRTANSGDIQTTKEFDVSTSITEVQTSEVEKVEDVSSTLTSALDVCISKPTFLL